MVSASQIFLLYQAAGLVYNICVFWGALFKYWSQVFAAEFRVYGVCVWVCLCVSAKLLPALGKFLRPPRERLRFHCVNLLRHCS